MSKGTILGRQQDSNMWVDIPPRTLLSITGTSYLALTKRLTNLLEPIQKDLLSRSPRNMFDLVEVANYINVKSKTIFPLETAQYLWFDGATYIPCRNPSSYLNELVQCRNMKVQFPRNGKCHGQVNDVPIFSSFGHLLADILIGKLEKLEISSEIAQLHIYYRQVDGIFALFSGTARATELLRRLTHVHTSVHHTRGRERESTPLLGAHLSNNEDGSIESEVYGEPTGVGSYITFNSAVTLRCKGT